MLSNFCIRKMQQILLERPIFHNIFQDIPLVIQGSNVLQFFLLDMQLSLFLEYFLKYCIREHIEIPTDSDFEPGTVLELVCTEDDTVICTLPESIDDTEEWIFNQAEFLEKVREE